MIELKYLSKTFQMKDGAVKALQNINLTIPDGALYGIIGMSGAGNSTLVRCISRLNCWKIMVISRRRSRSWAAFQVSIAVPSITTLPSVGRSSRLMPVSYTHLPRRSTAAPLSGVRIS